MLEVAEKLFAKPGMQRSGIASTHRSLSLQTMVPFILPSKVSFTQPTRCGRGMIVPVAGPVNAHQSITVTHNLGRKVQFMWPLINGGNNFTPKLKFDQTFGATSNQQEQAILADEVMESCLILFF
jgi:hypothetical protein